MNTTITDPKVFYYGTPVVLVSSLNEDGTTNIAPMSSAWWLGKSCMMGFGVSNKTTGNLLRCCDCVLNMVPVEMVEVIDRLALLTASRIVPEHKTRRGYRYEADKFAAAGLTQMQSDLVRPSRVAESPIQMEGRVVAKHEFGAPYTKCMAFEVVVLRTHVEDRLLVPARPNYIDPMKWDPLIMKFTEFFGGGENVHSSQLARGWKMEHETTGVMMT